MDLANISVSVEILAGVNPGSYGCYHPLGYLFIAGGILGLLVWINSLIKSRRR